MIQRVLQIVSTTDSRPNIIKRRPALLVLTGPVNSGKSRTLRRWLCTWEEEGWSLGGIVSDAVWNFNMKFGYDLVDLTSGKAWPVLRTSGFSSEVKIGKYHVDVQCLGEVAHAACKTPDRDLLVLDEVGPLEMERNDGLIDVLTTFLLKQNSSLCVVVRDSLLDTFLERYQHFRKSGRMLL